MEKLKKEMAVMLEDIRGLKAAKEEEKSEFNGMKEENRKLKEQIGAMKDQKTKKEKTVKSEQQRLVDGDHYTAAAELAFATKKQPWPDAGTSQRIVAGLCIVIVSMVGNFLGDLSSRMLGGGKWGIACPLMGQSISVWIGHKLGYGSMIGAVIGQIIGGSLGQIIGKMLAAFGYQNSDAYGLLLGLFFGTWIGLEMGRGWMCCALIGGFLGIGCGEVIGPLLLESIGCNMSPIDDNNKLFQLKLCKEVGMTIGTGIGLMIRLIFIH